MRSMNPSSFARSDGFTHEGASHEIVNALDPLRMWNTLISVTDGCAKCTNQSEDAERGEGSPNRAEKGKVPPYDPRLVLCCLMEAAKAANIGRLNLRAFITRNCLSFAFAATSLPDAELRQLAYAVIGRFHKCVGRRRDEGKAPVDGLREERPLFTFAIRLFRDSVHETGQRVCRVVAHFFARLCKLMLAPTDPCFAPLMAFLALKPRMRLDTVPEFLKLFFSSSTEHHRAERQWVLKLCAESTCEPRDYQVLSKVYVLELMLLVLGRVDLSRAKVFSYALESCMSLFASPIADLRSKLLMLRLFEQCVAMPSSARDMHRRLGFGTWLAQAVEFSRTTQFEELRLAAIFAVFAKMVENVHGGGGDGSSELAPTAKRPKRHEENGGDEAEWSDIDKLTLRTNLERILARLTKISTEEGGDERSRCVKRLKRLKRRALRKN